MRARRPLRSGLAVVLITAWLCACGGGGGGLSSGNAFLLPLTPGSVGGGPHTSGLYVHAVNQYTGDAVGAVTVVVGHGGGAATRTTSAQGYAIFDNLTPGPVTVTLLRSGYIPITIVDVDARLIELPMVAIDMSVGERTIAPLGIPRTYIGGWGEVYEGPAGGYAFDLVDDGSGGVVTDPDPLVTHLLDDLPTAMLVLAFDPGDPLGLSVHQGYREYPYGPPRGTLHLPMQPRRLRTFGGVLSVPDAADGGFDLSEPEVDVEVLAFAHLAAMGDLTVGRLRDPVTVQSRTFASFETATGNALPVVHVPRDGGYAIGVAIDDDSVPGEERGSVQLYRGAYADMPPVIAFDDFRRPPAGIDVSRSLTPTVTWTHADPPGRDGGLLAVGLFGDEPETSWLFLVAGDATSLAVPDYTGLALSPDMAYEVSVGAIYAPTFAFTAFTFAELFASWTHDARAETTFVTPKS